MAQSTSDRVNWLGERLAAWNVPVARGPLKDKDGTKWILKECPFNSQHLGTSVAVGYKPERGYWFKCQHDGCRDRSSWNDFRRHFEPAWNPPKRGSRFATQSDSVDSEYASSGVAPPAWVAPTPLEDEYGPPFPLDALPSWLRDWSSGVRNWLQVPPGLPAQVGLGALSTACGGRVVVRGPNGNLEPLNDYSLCSLPPGARKTPAFSAAVDPIIDYQTAAREAAREDLAREASRYRQKHARLKALESKSATAKTVEDRGAAAAEAEVLAAEISGLQQPHTLVLVLNDVTPEKVAAVLAEQGGRLAVLSAEGDPLDIIGGRYSDGVPRLGVFLAGHSGDYIAPGRISRDSPEVRKPALTFAMTIQPSILAGLARRPDFRGRGLLARFWYSVEPSTVGYRKVAERRSLTPSVALAYRDNLTRLLKLTEPFTSDKPSTLELTPGASDLLLDAEKALEPELRPFGRYGGIVDWASKWIGLMLRNAGRLHMAEHADPLNAAVTERTMRRALTIGTYQIEHALVAFGQMGMDQRVEGARWILNWVRDLGQGEFTRRDVHSALRGRTAFKRVESLDPPLALLVEHGYVRPLPKTKRQPTPTNPLGAGQPPSPSFGVNPLWDRGNAGGPTWEEASPESTESVQAANQPGENASRARDRSNGAVTSASSGATLDECLREILAKGPLIAEEVRQQLATEFGNVSRRDLLEARQRLGIRIEHDHESDTWLWVLPQPEEVNT